MKKPLIILFLFISINVNVKAKSIVNEVVDIGKITKDAHEIILNLGLNCADPTQLPKNVAFFVQELIRIVTGIGRVATESALQLALKPDFPNLCHVMTKSHIETYRENNDTTREKKCSLKGPFGKCLAYKKIKKERPKPSYYWPLYFVEVTKKGFDSHPTFAKKNALHTANRKLSASLSKLIDINGAVKLTSIVMGGKSLLGAVGMNVGDNDFGEVSKAAVLTPFEKMRIRSNDQKSNSTYDVNLWPVALSELIASHFSVCGPVLQNQGKRPGGYSWAFKGVPQTCAVAMSSDAYAMWDTGALSYIDPEEISAMAIGSNPLTCGAAIGLNALSNLGGFKAGPVGEQGKITESLSQLSDNFKKGLKTCSWPVLGTSMAIAKKALSLASASKWKQAKCTFWGSIAPRMSSASYDNDYSYANAGLKFKLLAHELFGVPRGREERWSLAYPWEGPGSSSTDKYGSLSNAYDTVKTKMGGVLKELGIGDGAGKSPKSRSEGLLSPGSPLMVNASYSSKYFTDQIKNFAKEAGYITGLTAASLSARNAAIKKLEREYRTSVLTHDQVLQNQQRQLSDTEEDTAHENKEAIWKNINYCHKRDSLGNIYSGKTFAVNGQQLSFRKGIGESACLSKGVVRGCLEMKRGKCRNPNRVQSVFLSRKEIVGYRLTKHPVHKRYSVSCNGLGEHHHIITKRWLHKKRRSLAEVISQTNCRPIEVHHHQDDTTQYVARPDPNSPSTLTRNSSTNDAIVSAATAAPWVAAEVARAKYSEILGNNPVPGNKRIYTIWEKIQCTYPSTRISVKVGMSPEVRKYEDCQSAIRFEIYKYIQTKLLRKICDVMGKKVGEPWK